MVITLVPAPFIFAPILFKKVATFTISGSLATFSITVFPLAFTAASIVFIVAPTLGISRYILAPFNSSASTIYLFPSSITTAPRARYAFKVWSIGLSPIVHPPGKYISTCLYFPNNDDIK